MSWWQKVLETLGKNAANLLKVKTLITLMVLGAVTYGFIKQFVPVELFVTIASAIVTYYFTKTSDKEGEV